MSTSKTLTIVEGPDGAGKSVFAKQFAEATGARYVHFSALPRVNAGLARMYVEAMLPALLGYQDVVFDRCWLSELPYGLAFREGKDRLGEVGQRLLERLALRCGAVVVRCQPDWETVEANYLRRKHLELLDNEQQLKLVYDLYSKLTTDLPTLAYDYELDSWSKVSEYLYQLRLPRHPVKLASAGSWVAPVVLVGEAFAERKDQDPWYQWPFASFSKAGCSQWLTMQLKAHNIFERNLLWVNADQDLSFLHDLDPELIVALGVTAQTALQKHEVLAETVPHPQVFKRFHAYDSYPLVELLKDYR